MALNLRLDQQRLHYGLLIAPFAHQPENENHLLSRQPVNMGSLKDLIDYRTFDCDTGVGRLWDVGQIHVIGNVHRVFVDATLDIVDPIARPLECLIGAVRKVSTGMRES